MDAPHPGTIGIPLPDTDCQIIDLLDPDREVAPGERGELCVKGPQVMLGYWNKPEATAEMIRNGWLHTGDIATMDEDGFFRIVDRLKDIILVSGFNVYPTEVEGVLYRHPDVLEGLRRRRARRGDGRACQGVHRAEGRAPRRRRGEIIAVVPRSGSGPYAATASRTRSSSAIRFRRP